MLDKEEIEARLSNLPAQQSVGFSVRMAMRVLPLLATQKKVSAKRFGGAEGFRYWEPIDRARHVLAVFRAQNAALYTAVVAPFKSAASAAANASAFAAADVPAYARSAASYATSATADAATSAAAHVKNLAPFFGQLPRKNLTS